MADDHEHVHRAAEPAAHDHDAHDHDEHEHHHHDHEHEHDSEPIDYEDAVAEFRRDKDEFFKTGPRSPVPVDTRASFEGIPYFPIDPACASRTWRSSRTPAANRRISRSRPRTASSGRRIGRGPSSSSSAGSRGR